MEEKPKEKKTRIKKLFKDLLKSDAHITILIDQFGKIKLYTDVQDQTELAYILTFVGNDIIGKAPEFNTELMKEMKERVGEQVKQEEVNDK